MSKVKTITIFGRKGCQQCNLTKMKMGREKTNPVFEYVDIDEKVDAKARVSELGYMALPVVEYGESHYSGFRPDKITEFSEMQSSDLANYGGEVEYQWV